MSDLNQLPTYSSGETSIPVSWGEDNPDPGHMSHPSHLALVQRRIRGDPPVHFSKEREHPIIVQGSTPIFDDPLVGHIIFEKETIFLRDLPEEFHQRCLVLSDHGPHSDSRTVPQGERPSVIVLEEPLDHQRLPGMAAEALLQGLVLRMRLSMLHAFVAGTGNLS